MAETAVIPKPHITDKDGILKVLNSMAPEAFKRRLNVGLSLFKSEGKQNPYAKELFEDNETNKEMWKNILQELGLFKTHKFEIKQYYKDGFPQFHEEDGSKKMLVFFIPKNPSGGGKK